MSIQSTVDGICRYFGGPYDPQTRTYRSSPLSGVGVGVVRRGWPKRDNHSDYTHGQQPGARTGCQIVVYIPRRHESRRAVGGEHNGQKQITYEVQMCCYVRSTAAYAEDAQDDVYDLQEALLEWIRRDRTLGNAVWQAGEHTDDGSDGIDVTTAQSETRAEATKSYFEITFAAVEWINA